MKEDEKVIDEVIPVLVAMGCTLLFWIIFENINGFIPRVEYWPFPYSIALQYMLLVSGNVFLSVDYLNRSIKTFQERCPEWIPSKDEIRSFVYLSLFGVGTVFFLIIIFRIYYLGHESLYNGGYEIFFWIGTLCASSFAWMPSVPTSFIYRFFICFLPIFCALLGGDVAQVVWIYITGLVIGYVVKFFCTKIFFGLFKKLSKEFNQISK